MKLPAQSWGTRYLGSTAFNTRVTFVQPNSGNAADGTPMPETVVAKVWASVAKWRGKQVDKTQTLQATSSYIITIRYPKTWNVDTGMNILIHDQRHNVDSFIDPDGQRVELVINSWVGDDTVVNTQ